ncbi:MAG: hypothetical protein M0Z80_03985 [Treponema sp.]|nr:hypothetical protein [Treponema sp.]
MTLLEWREQTYRELFESVLGGLERRKAQDPGFRLADAEGTLEHLYIQDGNDWIGRGEVQDLHLGATIAAYEHFIAAWKSESAAP